MKRAKRLWIKGNFLLGITGVAVLLVGFLFSRAPREGSPAVSSSALGWVFEVVERVEEEFEDEAGFWKGLSVRRRFGVDVPASLNLNTEFTIDVAVGPDDSALCIVCYDETNGELRYAEKTSPLGWNIVTIDSVGDVGKYPAIAIDVLGGRHVSYYDATNGWLKYAECNGDCLSPPGTPGSGWSIPETVPDPERVEDDLGKWTEITADGGNLPHISYVNVDKKSVKHAYKDLLDIWRISTVENGQHPQDLVASTSIGAGEGDTLHITYTDRNQKTLKYATSSYPYTSWTSSTIPDPWSDEGLWNSIAVDLADTIHISYSASDSLCEFKALKYAKGKP